MLTSGGCKSLTKVSLTMNTFNNKYGSENEGAKVFIREGNSPDRQLRSLITYRVKLQDKGKPSIDIQEVGLEAAILFIREQSRILKKA